MAKANPPAKPPSGTPGGSAGPAKPGQAGHGSSRPGGSGSKK